MSVTKKKTTAKPKQVKKIIEPVKEKETKAAMKPTKALKPVKVFMKNNYFVKDGGSYWQHKRYRVMPDELEKIPKEYYNVIEE